MINFFSVYLWKAFSLQQKPIDAAKNFIFISAFFDAFEIVARIRFNPIQCAAVISCEKRHLFRCIVVVFGDPIFPARDIFCVKINKMRIELIDCGDCLFFCLISFAFKSIKVTRLIPAFQRSKSDANIFSFMLYNRY